MGVLAVAGTLDLPRIVQDAGIVLMIVLSWLTTPKALRVENGFTWHPIAEVAALFAGIFATMIPALAILNAHGGELACSTRGSISGPAARSPRSSTMRPPTSRSHPRRAAR